jgi:hypothetical protein
MAANDRKHFPLSISETTKQEWQAEAESKSMTLTAWIIHMVEMARTMDRRDRAALAQLDQAKNRG